MQDENGSKAGRGAGRREKKGGGSRGRRSRAEHRVESTGRGEEGTANRKGNTDKRAQGGEHIGISTERRWQQYTHTHTRTHTHTQYRSRRRGRSEIPSPTDSETSDSLETQHAESKRKLNKLTGY
jgi:hypothetical protein